MSNKIEGNKLPSQFQINDAVILNFFNSGTLHNCKVVKVAFNESQVFYDIEITIDGLPEELQRPDKTVTRLHNIRSLYVLSAEDTQSKTLITS